MENKKRSKIIPFVIPAVALTISCSIFLGVRCSSNSSQGTETKIVADVKDEDSMTVPAAAEDTKEPVEEVVEVEEPVNQYAEEYADYMVDNYYDGGDNGGTMYFDLPDSNGKGYGVYMADGDGAYVIFTYKIKSNGVLAVDYLAEEYIFFGALKKDIESWTDWDEFIYDMTHKDGYTHEGNVFYKHTGNNYPKAEVTFYSRSLEYYNRQTGESAYFNKKYLPFSYNEAMKDLRLCKDKAIELEKELANQ